MSKLKINYTLYFRINSILLHLLLLSIILYYIFLIFSLYLFILIARNNSLFELKHLIYIYIWICKGLLQNVHIQHRFTNRSSNKRRQPLQTTDIFINMAPSLAIEHGISNDKKNELLFVATQTQMQCLNAVAWHLGFSVPLLTRDIKLNNCQYVMVFIS